MTELTLHRPQPTYDLRITTVRHDAELLAVLTGRLNAHTSDLLMGCCRSWADDGMRSIVVDLSALTDLDGWGVAALVRSRRVLRAHAGTLRVTGAPEGARQLLARTGLSTGTPASPGSPARPIRRPAGVASAWPAAAR
jgi:anti-anti-sigma factor